MQTYKSKLKEKLIATAASRFLVTMFNLFVYVDDDGL
jgi:hypothetical protein